MFTCGAHRGKSCPCGINTCDAALLKYMLCVCVYSCVYAECRCCAVSAAHGGRAEQGSELTWLGHPPAQLLVLLWLFCGVLCQAARLHLLLQVTPHPLLAFVASPPTGSGSVPVSPASPLPCHVLPCPCFPQSVSRQSLAVVSCFFMQKQHAVLSGPLDQQQHHHHSTFLTGATWKQLAALSHSLQESCSTGT